MHFNDREQSWMHINDHEQSWMHLNDHEIMNKVLIW